MEEFEKDCESLCFDCGQEFTEDNTGTLLSPGTALCDKCLDIWKEEVERRYNGTKTTKLRFS